MILCELPFVYYDETQTGFAVVGVSPTSGPLQGGQTVFVGGSGFTEQTEVRIDGRVASCELVSSNQLRCVTPPGSPGEAPVDVSEGGDRRISFTPQKLVPTRFPITPRKLILKTSKSVSVIETELNSNII